MFNFNLKDAPGLKLGEYGIDGKKKQSDGERERPRQLVHYGSEQPRIEM